MACDPVRDRERYGLFLRVQYLFHRDIDALYLSPALQAVLPDLDRRRRVVAIRRDIAGLGRSVPAEHGTSASERTHINLPTAFGWL
ncbi:hypothetical protein [Sphingomonas koreensis]